MDRIIITTGGTGGHIFPALAVAEEIRRRHPQCRILFIGGSGPEGELAHKAGLEFKALPARGVLGKGAKGILALLRIGGSVIMSLGIIRNFKPQAVVGFGGYAGFSPVLAARIMGRATAIHEQNSVPGAANRLLGKFVDTVFISFEEAQAHFNAEKTLLVGNPVRRDIFEAAKGDDAAPSGLNLLILGGSQGAVAVNNAIIKGLNKFSEAKVNILHQSGPADEERVRAAYEKAGLDSSSVQGFIENMAETYAWADLVVCRAGASTVFEVAAAGKPALFIPFPHATHDHQTVNALALARTGAARVLNQNNMNDGDLATTVLTLLGSVDELKRMGQAAAIFARPKAAEDMVSRLETMAGKAA